MRPKHNKSLSIPLTPQREKASGKPSNSPAKKNEPQVLNRIVFRGLLYQFFDVGDLSVVVIDRAQLLSTLVQEPIGKIYKTKNGRLQVLQYTIFPE